MHLACTLDEDDTQTANELIADILDESVYAEEVGLYSAWVGSYRRPACDRPRHSPTSGSNGLKCKSS